MLDDLFTSLSMLADGHHVLVAFSGVVLGLFFGILPGLSGLTALAILLPFVYGMEPMAGLSFLLAAHAAVYTGGSVTAILLGIPGAPANSATVTDGFALHQQGRGAFAVGAALSASACGGVLSAMVLILLFPVLQPLVMMFGAPEVFLLALIGIIYVAALGQGEPTKGLVAAGLGLFLAMVGYQRISSVPRFWMGSDYLLDGIRVIPMVLGLFAFPEIVALARGRVQQKNKAGRLDRHELWQGAKAVFKNPIVFLQSTLIGIFVGIVPGVGGETAPFMAYAAAKRKARGTLEEEQIIGVIAPESSNNAKEGGSLVPTLALGIPGSAGMAVMMGGFLVLGLEPGPDFLQMNMPLAIGLAIVLAVTNVISATLMVPLAGMVASLAKVEGRTLAPLLLIMVVLGAYASGNNLLDIIAVFIFGLLGLVMKEFNYSRPALILGFILGPIIETYFSIAVQAYGFSMLKRPGTVALVVILVLGLGLSLRSSRDSKLFGGR